MEAWKSNSLTGIEHLTPVPNHFKQLDPQTDKPRSSCYNNSVTASAGFRLSASRCPPRRRGPGRRTAASGRRFSLWCHSWDVSGLYGNEPPPLREWSLWSTAALSRRAEPEGNRFQQVVSLLGTPRWNKCALTLRLWLTLTLTLSLASLSKHSLVSGAATIHQLNADVEITWTSSM